MPFSQWCSVDVDPRNRTPKAALFPRCCLWSLSNEMVRPPSTYSPPPAPGATGLSFSPAPGQCSPPLSDGRAQPGRPRGQVS